MILDLSVLQRGCQTTGVGFPIRITVILTIYEQLKERHMLHMRVFCKYFPKASIISTMTNFKWFFADSASAPVLEKHDQSTTEFTVYIHFSVNTPHDYINSK